MKQRLAVLLILACFSASLATGSPEPAAAKQILADTGIPGGLVWGGDEPGVHSRERTTIKREGRNPRTGQVQLKC